MGGGMRRARCGVSRPVTQVCVLGSTGSVGENTLAVMARHPDRYRAFALTANRQIEPLAQQCAIHRPRFAVVGASQAARALTDRLLSLGVAGTAVLHGPTALCEVASDPSVDAVMGAIVGAAGLAPVAAAAAAGKRVLLANKEAIVLGGAWFMSEVRRGAATLLPVDSEHSAIFQCMPSERTRWQSDVEKLVLTASGGPFRTRDLSSFADVTPAEACAHPNWVMGRKISVDSATMMNKALEVIEARWLFDMSPQQIEVVIHPQSVIHSMVVMRDASVLAQLGTPDMKVPIACALAWPDRVDSGAAGLDFRTLASLSFEEPDLKRFPALALAWQVLGASSGASAILNAANEVAVAAFLEGNLRFDRIAAVAAEALSRMGDREPELNLEAVLALDAEARIAAESIVSRWQAC
jgi:1-deoxy-D-xylulose-5-phosphate reductoisomerase